MRGFNAYNTDNAEQLLMLKRQESTALLEIVRRDRPETGAADMIRLVMETCRVQLGVRRMLFIYLLEGELKKEHEFGFPPIEQSELDFLLQEQQTRELVMADDELAAAGVEYVIPLLVEGEPRGWFLVADFAESEAETQNDIIFMETAGHILLSMLERRRMSRQIHTRQLLEKELELAASLQNKVLPRDFRIHHQLDVFGHIQPHFEIGGDFYDLIPVGKNQLVFCIGDASGKGIPAALLITHIHAGLRSLAELDLPLDALVRHLHRLMRRITLGEMFATMFIGRIDLQTGRLQFVNAGHHPPVLVQQNELEHLDEGCIPLGMLELPELEVGQRQLEHDSVLMLYTDGLVEQANAQGEILGESRLAERLKRIARLEAELIVDNLLGLLRDHRREAPGVDDVTLLALKRRNHEQEA